MAAMERSVNLEDYVPPFELFNARADYAEVARKMFGLLLDQTGLQPHERVLDVGCGTGRIAVPLTAHLDERGSYEGFDNSGERIDWCNERIAPLHPNFRFQAVDVFSSLYHRTGSIKPEEFSFPYPDDDFDVVFLFSVFTHIRGAGVERYLREIARVLRPGGRSMITWFLLNDESKRSLEQQADTRSDPASNAYNAAFSHNMGHYRLSSLSVPEGVVGFEEDWARAEYEAAGLAVQEPIHYGDWTRDRTDTLINQDIVIAHKR